MSNEYHYTVRVADMFHYQDRSEEYELGEFESCGKAIEKCQDLMAEYLPTKTTGQRSVEELMEDWWKSGEEPYIVTNDPNCKFSASDYLREACEKFVRENGGSR